MIISNDDLKKILVDQGYLTSEEFDDVVKSASDLGRKIDDILIFRGYLNNEALGKMIAERLGVPYINVARQTISDEILHIIPEKLARTYRIIAFAKDGNTISVAMEDPGNFEALEYTRRQTGMQVTPYYANAEDIRRAMGQYKRNIREDFDVVIKENVKEASLESDPTKAAEKLPIIKMLDTILVYAVAERASDVHIETGAQEVVVRFRIDGILHDIIKLPRGIETALIARIKILSNLKIDEHRIPQDGRYKFAIDDEMVALRISIIPGFYGENVVMRILQESARPLSLEELGVSGHNLELLKENMSKPHGMILVTGPTGSGKTTTLYSVLNILNTVKVKICTIEDPVEYGVSRVAQIQVNQKTGMDFAAGLRALLRHDPDIIMVGEIRDKETASISVNAALTGHLVLSTLHTNDAVGAIPRLLDMGVEGYLLASTLNIVLAQRLVRKICSACIKEYQPGQEILKRFKDDFDVDLSKSKFYKGAGCVECRKTGYSGRIGIYEVLAVTEEVREAISKTITSDDLQKLAVQQGMVSMLADGVDKVSSGLTTVDELLRVVREG